MLPLHTALVNIYFFALLIHVQYTILHTTTRTIYNTSHNYTHNIQYFTQLHVQYTILHTTTRTIYFTQLGEKLEHVC